jgi:hypothetical protein
MRPSRSFFAVWQDTTGNTTLEHCPLAKERDFEISSDRLRIV